MERINMPRNFHQDLNYVRLIDLGATHGLSISTTKRLLATDPSFPQPIRLTARTVLFNVKEVDCWLEQQRGKAPRNVRGEAEAA
jgi:predicted DNA-binding transcriptional regulator AlpA